MPGRNLEEPCVLVGYNFAQPILNSQAIITYQAWYWFCLEFAKGVLPVLEETTDPSDLELAKGVLEDPTVDRVSFLEDLASFLLILDPWLVLVPLVEVLELNDLTEPPAIGSWPTP